jgi:hypothetical protein
MALLDTEARNSFMGVEAGMEAGSSKLEARRQILSGRTPNEHPASSFQFRYELRQRQTSFDSQDFPHGAGSPCPMPHKDVDGIFYSRLIPTVTHPLTLTVIPDFFPLSFPTFSHCHSRLFPTVIPAEAGIQNHPSMLIGRRVRPLDGTINNWKVPSRYRILLIRFL